MGLSISPGLSLGSGLQIAAPIGGAGLAAFGFPENVVLPAITGTPQVGQTLTSSTGTWEGVGSITYAYQWNRSGTPISGADEDEYELVGDDEGEMISVTVTATNSVGSNPATSAEVGPVEPA